MYKSGTDDFNDCEVVVSRPRLLGSCCECHSDESLRHLRGVDDVLKAEQIDFHPLPAPSHAFTLSHTTPMTRTL